GTEVAVAAMEVGYGQEAVLEDHGVDEAPAPAHVEDDGDARLLRLGPHGIEPDVAGRVRPRARRRHEQRLAPHLERLAGGRPRPLEVRQRDVTRWEKPGIDRAELDERPVVRPREAVREVEVVAVLDALEGLVGEGVEDELTGDAEHVESGGSVLGDEAAGRLEVLSEPDLLGVVSAELRVRLHPAEVLDDLALVGAVVADPE